MLHLELNLVFDLKKKSPTFCYSFSSYVET